MRTGDRALRSRRKVITIVVAVALGSIVAGFGAGARVVSPADRAARASAPPASPVTAPVERRSLQSQVVTRGDTSFAGAVDVRIETGDLDTQPVVTGTVPAVGAEVKEKDVLLEIGGRPVLVLGGALPTYRTLRPGSTGPDVRQLEDALTRLGLDPGTVDDDYDTTTGDAVAGLYQQVGYEPPEQDVDAVELSEAQAALAMAEANVTAATQALELAQAGPPQSEVLAAQAEVNAAARANHAAHVGGDAAAEAAATDQLAIAQAHLQELQVPPETGEQQAALDASEAERDGAASAVFLLQAGAGTPLPASEVVFLPDLPRRVDEVSLTRGSVIEGAVMRVSGAQLIVTARIGADDRRLVTDDMPVVVEHAGLRIDGKVTSIGRGAGSAPAGSAGSGGSGDSTGSGGSDGDQATSGDTDGSGAASDGGASGGSGNSGSSGSSGGEAEQGGGFDVVVTPSDLSADQVELLRESNVKLTIPVEATDGEVLVVPLAALTAGPGGQSRVEVVAGDGGDEPTTLVPVEVGLSADGYAEIRPRDPGVAVGEGDLVVVGRSA